MIFCSDVQLSKERFLDKCPKDEMNKKSRKSGVLTMGKVIVLFKIPLPPAVIKELLKIKGCYHRYFNSFPSKLTVN